MFGATGELWKEEAEVGGQVVVEAAGAGPRNLGRDTTDEPGGFHGDDPYLLATDASRL
jgi:hypothetical protein